MGITLIWVLSVLVLKHFETDLENRKPNCSLRYWANTKNNLQFCIWIINTVFWFRNTMTNVMSNIQFTLFYRIYFSNKLYWKHAEIRLKYTHSVNLTESHKGYFSHSFWNKKIWFLGRKWIFIGFILRRINLHTYRFGWSVNKHHWNYGRI